MQFQITVGQRLQYLSFGHKSLRKRYDILSKNQKYKLQRYRQCIGNAELIHVNTDQLVHNRLGLQLVTILEIDYSIDFSNWIKHIWNILHSFHLTI